MSFDRKGPRRRSRPTSIGGLVGGLSRRFNVGPTLAVIKAWPRVAGEVVAKNLQPVRFVEGVLWVRSDQSVWSHQLTFLRPDLLARYEAELGRKIVDDIRLTVSAPVSDAPGFGPGKKSDGEEGPRLAGGPPVADLSADELAAIEARAAEHIRDPKLRARWSKLEAVMRATQRGRKQAGQAACTACGLSHPGPGKFCPVCYGRSLKPPDPMRPL
ncbi:MAG: DUF721 domain-containing protein [Candidatus Sericytochromatia bacterium]|uniref:DUF721 domain-containing protein n=1 Tax=Candidatus Tanganyikabacteria bacterium TaxID=2961651 RepID=A0A938BMH4_9BACT|nr:DUF721 domain-containing protein [Candidatus Tanganyikabacteria bacterium]